MLDQLAPRALAPDLIFNEHRDFITVNQGIGLRLAANTLISENGAWLRRYTYYKTLGRIQIAEIVELCLRRFNECAEL